MAGFAPLALLALVVHLPFLLFRVWPLLRHLFWGVLEWTERILALTSTPAGLHIHRFLLPPLFLAPLLLPRLLLMPVSLLLLLPLLVSLLLLLLLLLRLLSIPLILLLLPVPLLLLLLLGMLVGAVLVLVPAPLSESAISYRTTLLTFILVGIVHLVRRMSMPQVP